MVWKDLEYQGLRKGILEILEWKANIMDGLRNQKASKIKRKEHEIS
jgi:hypothetical protein